MKKITAIAIILGICITSNGFSQTCGTTNIGLNKPVTVSRETQYHEGYNAVDNNSATSWYGPLADSAYLYVDLQQAYTVCQIVISWTSNGRAANYKIQTSTNTTSWTDIYTMTGNTATTNTLTVNGTGRYIRIWMTSHVNTWASYEIVDIAMYNSLAGNMKPRVSLTAPSNNATFYEGANITLSATASDTDGTVSKVEFFQGSTKIGEDATSPYS